MQGGHTGCSLYYGAAEDAFCSSYWKACAQALCSVHKASGVPVWSGSPVFSYKLSSCINIQGRKMTESRYSTAKMQTIILSTFFQASHQVQDCIANWFSLHPQPSRSIPWGQSLQEEGWERLSHCWTHQHPVLCHIKWIKLVPRESLLKMPEVQLIC